MINVGDHVRGPWSDQPYVVVELIHHPERAPKDGTAIIDPEHTCAVVQCSLNGVTTRFPIDVECLTYLF